MPFRYHPAAPRLPSRVAHRFVPLHRARPRGPPLSPTMQEFPQHDPPPRPPAWLGLALTLLAGVVLIALVTPIAQLLTYRTITADIEVAAPVGWALGLVFTLVLLMIPIWLLARLGGTYVRRPHLVLLFTMLTIAAPLMNLGLVRPAFLSMYAVINEHLYLGNSTYRTVYDTMDDEWFPLVPTVEGLAYAKADRVLTLLDDPAASGERKKAQQKVLSYIAGRAAELEVERGEGGGEEGGSEGSEGGGDSATQTPDEVLRAVDRLGVEEVRAVVERFRDKPGPTAVLQQESLDERLATRERAAIEASAQARARLLEAMHAMPPRASHARRRRPRPARRVRRQPAPPRAGRLRHGQG